MSRATMLRTRRKDVNIKPNRRLDRKSSRGMIYENEELRLRTININAEVEKGQSDIKKLRRENEQLRREIWFIRNEYEKLENKLLHSGAAKSDGSEESSTTCSSEEDSEESSCPSCAGITEESSQNYENGEKVINRNNLHVEFDHLSVVSEENSLEKSSDSPEQNRTNTPTCKTNSILGPDQSYPETSVLNKSIENFPRNFFAPLPVRKKENDNTIIYEKTSPDVYVNEAVLTETSADRCSFQSGGNLDQLLQDMDNISKDILQYSSNIKSVNEACSLRNPFMTTGQTENPEICNSFIQIDSNVTPDSSPQINETEPNFTGGQKPYKSEINVVLVPNPMPLIGFEKYKLTQQSNPDISLTSQQFMEKLNLDTKSIEPSSHSFEFHSHTFPQFQQQISFNSNSTIDTSRNLNIRSCNTTPVPPICDAYQTSSPILSRVCQFCQIPLVNDSQNNMICRTCVPYNLTTQANTLSSFNFDVQPYQNSTLLKTSQENVTPVTETHNKKHVPNVLELPSSTVQIHVSDEINSPKIIKENFPSENEADVHPKSIDDTNLDKTSSSDDKPPKSNQTNEVNKGGKIRKHRKLSIHFNGSKKLSRSVSLDTNTTSSATNSKHLDTPLPLLNDPLKSSKQNDHERDSVTPTPNVNPKKSPNLERKMSLTSNTSSVDKKHVKIEGSKTEKKHKHEGKKRRKNSTGEKLPKTRHDSIDLPRTSKHESWLHNRQYDSFNEFTSFSERERTNSLTSESSRNTSKSRKLSEYSTLNNGGKVPWCGCWGNGCL